jgi:hypothetical protein
MRAPLVFPNDSRDAARSKDEWGVNVFGEKGEDEVVMAVKRPGVGMTSPTSGDTGQGLGNFDFNYVTVINDVLYTYSAAQLPCALPFKTLTGSLGTVSLGQAGCGVGAGGVVGGISLVTGSSVLYSPGASYPIDTPVLAQDPLTGEIKTYYANSPQAAVAIPGASSTPGLLWRTTPAPTGHLWQVINTPIRGNSSEACIAAYLCTSFVEANPTAFVIYSTGASGTLVYVIPPDNGPHLEFNFSLSGVASQIS